MGVKNELSGCCYITFYNTIIALDKAIATPMSYDELRTFQGLIYV